MQTMSYDSPGTSFLNAKNLGEFLSGSPPLGVPNRGAVGSNGDFQPICHYMLEMVQDRDSDSRMLIGTPMYCIDWCYFQSP